MGCAESIVDIDIAERGERGPERLHSLGLCFDFVLANDGNTFFFRMEADVFEKNNSARRRIGASSFNFGADTIR